MARPRLPQSKAEASGAALKNPGRFKDRKVSKRVRPLGDPYVRMTAEEKAAWEEFRYELPWLNSSHRAILQAACRLRARLSSDPDMGVSAITAYGVFLSKLGATPVDETKVNHNDDEEEGETDRFFN